MSLRLQKDGGDKSKQISWTNLSHWNAGGSSSRCEYLLLFLNLHANVQFVKHDHERGIVKLPPSSTAVYITQQPSFSTRNVTLAFQFSI